MLNHSSPRSLTLIMLEKNRSPRSLSESRKTPIEVRYRYWSCINTNMNRNAWVPDKTHSYQRIIFRTANGPDVRYISVTSFEQVKSFPPDRTDITGQWTDKHREKRTRNVKEWRQTDCQICYPLKSVHSLALSCNVWLMFMLCIFAKNGEEGSLWYTIIHTVIPRYLCKKVTPPSSDAHGSKLIFQVWIVPFF
jgi:hypothetical protein